MAVNSSTSVLYNNGNRVSRDWERFLMSLSHLKLWINNLSTPSGENAGLNKNHNFFTP